MYYLAYKPNVLNTWEYSTKIFNNECEVLQFLNKQKETINSVESMSVLQKSFNKMKVSKKTKYNSFENINELALKIYF